MIQKQTVYLSVKEDGGYSIHWGKDKIFNHAVMKEGYFFTAEELNEYTQNIIKQALETAAEKGICYINGFIQHSDGRQETQCFLDKQSIKNTFEESYKKFEV